MGAEKEQRNQNGTVKKKKKLANGKISTAVLNRDRWRLQGKCSSPMQDYCALSTVKPESPSTSTLESKTYTSKCRARTVLSSLYITVLQ